MPETAERIQVGDLKLTEAELHAILDVAGSDRLSPGPYVSEFEAQFASRHHSQYGVMTNSGTDALRIALATLKEAEGWKDGDVVIVPSVTFVATVNVILQLNLTPMLVDVGMYDHNLNPDNLLRRWPEHEVDADRIKALIAVHLCGCPADMPRLMAIAHAKNLKVIEDSCEAMGVGIGGKPVGSWGDIGCFSFYVAHLIATGVGGMAVTSNPRYEQLMRSYSNHGRDAFYIPGHRMPEVTKELLQKRFKFDRIGYSCRPTEFEAAIGLVQLKNLDASIAKRQANAKHLIAGLKTLPLVLPHRQWDGNNYRDHAYMMFPLVLADTTQADKWDLCLHLEKNGIETRELLPLVDQPCYKWVVDPAFYPMATRLKERGFYIGCHPHLSPADLERILAAFNSFAWTS